MEAPDNITEQIKEAARNAESKPFTGMENVWERVAAKLDADEPEAKVVPFLSYKKMAVAAAALILIGFGTGYFFSKKTTEHVGIMASHMNAEGITQAKSAEMDTSKNVTIIEKEQEDKHSMKLIDHHTASKEDNIIAIGDEAPVVSTDAPVMQIVPEKKRIEGKIVDDKGEGIPGAEVKLKGSKIGTFTDVDGNYQLKDVAADSPVIEISPLGYERKEIFISGNFNIGTTEFKQPVNALSEVAVTQPYGPPASKSKYTGAADVVNADKISTVPVLTKAIEDAAPGVQVTKGSGQPGAGTAMRVRGKSSLKASPTPLIILDGVPFNGDITTINPADVLNITILKDAGATSLYGSKGSNGVIVITTKKGPHQKEKWSLKRLFGKKQEVQNVDSLKQ